MVVTVNGSERELESGATVADLVDVLSGVPDGRGVAVAVVMDRMMRAPDLSGSRAVSCGDSWRNSRTGRG